jgi:hypothetical protein
MEIVAMTKQSTDVNLVRFARSSAENYGEGRSEEFISHVIVGQRDRVFLV